MQVVESAVRNQQGTEKENREDLLIWKFCFWIDKTNTRYKIQKTQRCTVQCKPFPEATTLPLANFLGIFSERCHELHVYVYNELHIDMHVYIFFLKNGNNLFRRFCSSIAFHCIASTIIYISLINGYLDFYLCENISRTDIRRKEITASKNTYLILKI